ncbi:hypothetical protein DCC81_12170 [Chitinophaga parva]|uniref:Uncharacterized protein n=1 Tax=Chitinophaga parva TaxID=2169414 RepID=A0A2T7BFK0_9BACT|nr:hypothetical protein DCC81_12170 [Chitinophaga parva]
MSDKAKFSDWLKRSRSLKNIDRPAVAGLFLPGKDFNDTFANRGCENFRSANVEKLLQKVFISP